MRPAPARGTTARASRDDARRRAELADFLRRRREAIAPEDVGLPGGGRRRTPGLRREEVAMLAGVGTTWYTWLEQGRDVRASLDVLEAIARALHFTPAERRHLVLLGRGTPPPPKPAPAERLSPTLKRLVANLDPTVAYVLGRRWDLLAWNRAYAAVFGDPGRLPREQRNAVWLTFTDPRRRAMLADWESGARRMLARFRADCARQVGDPAFDSLIDALREASAEFREWWPRHEVRATGDGRKELIHPEVGVLLFEHATFAHAEHPDHRLLLYTPLPDGDTVRKLESLLARDAGAAA